MEKFQFLTQDKWLSEIMNKDVYSMSINEAMHYSKAVVEKYLPKTQSFIFCKVPVSNIRATILIEQLGFNIVDTQIQMKKKNKW